MPKKQRRTTPVSSRLHTAIEQSKLSIRAFQQQIQKRLQFRDIRGGSYPSVHAYLGGTSEPSVQFLQEAARLLGVREAWLITGHGPMTNRQARFEKKANQRIGLAEPADDDKKFIERLLPDPQPQAARRRAAVLRFARKLDDAGFLDAPWSDIHDRRDLLAAAATFLVGVEEAFEDAGRQNPGTAPDAVLASDDVLASENALASESDLGPESKLARRMSLDHLLLCGSRSAGWYVTWSDAVLGLFSMRVIGLGERSSVLFDAHAPVSGPALDTESAEPFTKPKLVRSGWSGRKHR